MKGPFFVWLLMLSQRGPSHGLLGRGNGLAVEPTSQNMEGPGPA